MPVTVWGLNHISEKNKGKIKFIVLTQDFKDQNTIERVTEYIDKNLDSNINSEIIKIWKGFNYLGKVKHMIEQDVEYTIKLDEDCFCNGSVWDFLIENINVLNDDNNLLFAPVLSSGVPTVENFIESQLTEEEKKGIYDIFLKTNIPFKWGVDYTHLNKFTTKADKWDADGFYGAVWGIGHYYRGIHPIRISYEALEYINNLILKKIDQFKAKQNYKIVYNKRPYFCNSFFAIKTETYRKIYKDDSLFKDGLDEVPINLYKKRNDLQIAFIENSFGIHMVYRACPDKRIWELENRFYTEFEKAVL